MLRNNLYLKGGSFLYKKNLRKIVLLSFILITVISLLTISVSIADVGNFNRYDSGDSSYSSDSSTDGDSIFFLIYLFIEFIELLFHLGPIGLVIAIVLIILVYRFIKKHNITAHSVSNAVNNLENMSNQYNNTNNTYNAIPIMQNVGETIRQSDPAFSDEKFIAWTNEVFLKLQAAWTARDWKVIRPFESEELFAQHSQQLQEYINNKKINVIERIAIQNTCLINYAVDGDKEKLVVDLHAVMRDYIIDENTRAVLESDPNRDWHMKYHLTFARKVGVKTDPGTSNKSTTNCPNCGAPTEITSAGQCEYCRSVITTGEHDWVLINIKSY